MENDKFTPSDRTKAMMKVLFPLVGDQASAAFFDAWETEIENPDAPRRAGSVVATGYMLTAARVAVFGAQCAGANPDRDQWMKFAGEQFDQAVKDLTREGD